MTRRDSEPTISFRVSPHLLTVEGPSVALALLLDMLYSEPSLARNSWGVSHATANRPSFAADLRAAGSEHRRLGISATSKEAVEIIKRRAQGLKITCHVLRTEGP